jgi:beta-xylosidase
MLDAADLSDEGVPGGGFTGTFFGMCCQDLNGRRTPADFRLFGYVPERWP